MRVRSLLSVLIVTLVALVTRMAHASTESCAQAYEDAQRLRRDGKLLASRTQLVACSQDACPSVVRKQCTAWLAEVNDELPSVAVRVHGRDGCDRPDASVAVDGTEVTRAADGRTTDLDPGSHVVRATVDDAVTERVVVVSPGERRRIVMIDLAPAGTTCGAPIPAPAPRLAPTAPVPPVRTTEARPVPPLVYVLGATGLVSAGVGGTFGVLAWEQKGTLDECKGHCAQHDVDSMQRKFAVADLGSVIAVVSLGVAGVLYFTR